MSFKKPSTQVNQSGAFGYSQALTTSETNYIDNSFPNMLDKTGCTVTGSITLSNANQTTSPSGSNFFFGKLIYNVTHTPSNTTVYTADSNGYPDYIILVNTSTRSQTINIPAASAHTGRYIAIKDYIGLAAFHPFTINAASGNIDGVGSGQIISTGWYGIAVVSDGSNWSIVGNFI